ncbi:MAG: hypothetical protein ACKO7P_12795 [Bacteroidota bacterium]
MTEITNSYSIKKHLWIYIVFFISGWAAILYQLLWQRYLFTIFGSNIESTTIIVSAFMFGLGVGSIIGGKLSKKNNNSLLLIFAMVELFIGLFGFFSLQIFDFVGEATMNLNAFGTSIVSLGLVIIPTMLMGSTLPLLVQYFIQYNNNVGETLGKFYFVNTLGSAIGALVATEFIFKLFFMDGTIYFSVSLNLIAAIVVIYKYTKTRN